jgi:hypothetical protein
MKALIAWLNHDQDTHPILKAGIAHFQFVTIHPFMDGNGRTARALATLILYREGYDLKRFYSLEAHYAQDLRGYYQALHQCQGTRYYNQPQSDITSWLEYFIAGAAAEFARVKDNALAASRVNPPDGVTLPVGELQKIGPRERLLLTYFKGNLQIRCKDVCGLFQINERNLPRLDPSMDPSGYPTKTRRGQSERVLHPFALFPASLRMDLRPQPTP